MAWHVCEEFGTYSEWECSEDVELGKDVNCLPRKKITLTLVLRRKMGAGGAVDRSGDPGIK